MTADAVFEDDFNVLNVRNMAAGIALDDDEIRVFPYGDLDAFN